MQEKPHGSYLRFAAMIASSMAVMFALTYVNTYALEHVRWSETRVYMALIMGAAMAMVMLSFMTGMYRNRRANAAIYLGSLAVMGIALALLRTQATVQDTSYMKAMIPHHSIAVLTSERARIRDLRVRELADQIIESQRREIREMQWLINDIQGNGVASDPAAADARKLPEFAPVASRR